MKHLVIFLLIATGIIYLATHKSDVQRLMKPGASLSSNLGGERIVDLDPKAGPINTASLSVPGTITVIYFRDPECPACIVADRNLVDFAKVRPDIAIRKINLGKDWSPQQWSKATGRKIWMTPLFLIYDQNGRPVAEDDANDTTGQDLLYKWMNEEIRADSQRHQ